MTLNAPPFFEFYTKSLGNLDHQLFSLFWSKKFQECLNLSQNISNTLGSPLCLGMNNFLMYNHCHHILTGKSLDLSNFPTSFTKKELANIYEYQLSQENIYKKAEDFDMGTKNILTQPQILSKALLAAKIGLDYGCISAVETGTFLGASTYIFGGIFDTVFTIEADKDLYESSSSWLGQKSQNVKCMNGDSGVLLQHALESNKNKTLFFLDAHWSTGITSNEYGICPLLDELKIILSFKKDHVIVIDDIRCMGDEGYPDFAEIFSLIPQGKEVQINHDQMIII